MQLQLRPATPTTTPLARTLEGQGRRSSWLATQLGVHRNTMSRWVTGREPIPRARVAQIATLLDVPPTEVAPPSSTEARPPRGALALGYRTGGAAVWGTDPDLIPSPRELRRREAAA